MTYCVLAILLRAKMKVLFIVVLYEDGCYKKTTRPNTIKVWIYGRAMAMSKERCGARNWQRRPLNWKLTVVGLLLLILPFEAAEAISVRKCYQLLIKQYCVYLFEEQKWVLNLSPRNTFQIKNELFFNFKVQCVILPKNASFAMCKVVLFCKMCCWLRIFWLHKLGFF